MKQVQGKLASLLLCLTLAAGLLPACTTADAEKGSDGKTVVTMLYFTALPEFEALVESTYSDIDLQPELSTTATIDGDQERRLRAGHGTDLIATSQPADESASQYAADLSSYAFSDAYADTMSASLTQNGRTLYLPLPGQYYGYVANKTLFDQAGIALPTTEQELLAALETMRERGIGVGEDGANCGNQIIDNVSFGNYLVGRMVPDFLGTTEGVTWLKGLETKTSSFSGVWDSAFNELLALVESGCLSKDAISRKSNVISIEPRMATGQLAAAYGNSTMLAESRRLNEEAVKQGTADAYEYVMLPFFSTQGNSPWVLTAPASYIGINAAVANDESRAATLDACRRILDLLSTQEGQQAFADDNNTDVTYLKNASLTPSNEKTGLEEYIAAGYVYDVKFPGKIVEYLGQQTVEVVASGKAIAEGLAAVDDYYRNGSEEADYDLSIVGSVSHDLLYKSYNVRLEETELGNLVADSVAALADSPIAVVNGGGIRASLYEGDVYGSDLAASCPYDNKIVVLEMPGATLKEMLENSLTTWRTDDVPGGRFLQVSGLRYEFSPNADGSMGATLESVALSDGTPIEDDERYTVAVNDYMAGAQGYLDKSGDGFTMLNVYSDTAPLALDVTLVKETGKTYADALKDYFAAHEDHVLDPQVEGRITRL